MMRALWFSLICVSACTPNPAPVPAGDETEVVEDERAEHASMTLSIREVSQDGWNGRLVVATFTNGRDRAIRILPSERPAPLQELVAAESPPEPFVAIDGGFYDRQNQPMGLVRTGGETVHALGERGGSGVLVVERDVVRIVHRDAYEERAGVTEALQSIDRLVDGGRSLVSANASRRRAARSAVAIDAVGDLHLVVAFDERAVASESEARIQMGADATRSGPTMAQMAELLVRPAEQGGVGAQQALGLDGGLSTSMVVKSEARALTIVPYHATINAVLVTVNDE